MEKEKIDLSGLEFCPTCGINSNIITPHQKNGRRQAGKPGGLAADPSTQTAKDRLHYARKQKRAVKKWRFDAATSPRRTVPLYSRMR